MSILEGFGDDVLIGGSIVAVIVIIAIAWLSTAVRPLWPTESMWLVELRTSPNRSVIELTQIDSRQAAQLTSEGSTRLVRLADVVPSTEQNTDVQPSIDRPLLPETVDDARTLNSVVSGASFEEVSPSEDNETSSAILTAADGSVDANDNTNDNDESVAMETTTVESTADASADGDDEAQIRLKFVDDTSRLVRAWLSNTVAEFKRAHFTDDVSAGRTVRLIYHGQMLQDDSRSLASYGIRDDSTVHCHISHGPRRRASHDTNAFATQTGATQQTMAGDRGTNRFEIGNYMHIIFACKFALLWFFFVAYPQYFDVSSFFSLALCTCVYLAFVIASVRRPRENLRQSAVPTAAM